MLELVIALLVVVVVAALLFRYVIQVVTVREFERGVRFRSGRLAGLLSPGTHVAVRPFSEIQVLDGRPTSVTVPRQEILTADGVAVKVTLLARYVVVDPVTAVTGDQAWLLALHATLQAGLRAVIAGRTVEEILATRGDLGPAVTALVASDVARIGIELLGVDVRDVMVPAELKRASVAIVAARRDAEAAVERARGETAALRSLANAGQLIDEHPGLLQLRAMQLAEADAAGRASDSTLTLGLDERPPRRRASAGGGAEEPPTNGSAGGAPSPSDEGEGPQAAASQHGRSTGRAGTGG